MHIPLKDLMFEMRSLEPFPGVAARVLELSARKDVVPGELIDLVQTDPGMTATGDVGAITYDYAAPQIAIGLDGVETSGVILTDEIARLSIVASDVAYVMSNTVGEVRAVDQTMSASGLTYDVFFEDPEGEGTFKLTGNMEGLSFDGEGDLPLDMDAQDFNAMLSDGFDFDGTFGATGGGYDMTFNGPDGGGTINSASDGGTLRVAMGPDGLSYGVSQTGVNLNMLLTELPLPISVSAAEISTNLLVPLQKSEEEQDFGMAIGFSDLTMSDALWGLFDAAGQLPRDHRPRKARPYDQNSHRPARLRPPVAGRVVAAQMCHGQPSACNRIGKVGPGPRNAIFCAIYRTVLGHTVLVAGAPGQ